MKKQRLAGWIGLALLVGAALGYWQGCTAPPGETAGAGDLTVQQLRDRVADLEQRLAELEADEFDGSFEPTAPPEIQRRETLPPPGLRGGERQFNGQTVIERPLVGSYAAE